MGEGDELVYCGLVCRALAGVRPVIGAAGQLVRRRSERLVAFANILLNRNA